MGHWYRAGGGQCWNLVYRHCTALSLDKHAHATRIRTPCLLQKHVGSSKHIPDGSFAVMAPPAKRRRRNTVEASEDQDEQPRANTLTNFLLSSPSSPVKTRAPTESPSPLKNRTGNGRTTRRTQTQKTAASPSPKKNKDQPKFDDKGKTADLKLLFSNQAQKAKTSSLLNSRAVPIDDPIRDPISEDDEISELKASSSSLVGQHAKKRQRGGSETENAGTSQFASQRFLKPPTNAVVADDDLRPWSERFGPRNLDELAVHKRKVADVRRWLEDVIGGRMRQRLLILKGAAGSGKTTTVRLLANELGCELLEWKNPTGNAGTGFVSASAQFQDFLGRGGKFGALDLDEPSSTGHRPPLSSNPKSMMLIEEFPNTFSRSSSALTSFRTAILQYLSANTPSLSMFAQQSQRDPVKPVIIVISETLLTTTSAAADSLTAHRLLGPEILRHPGVGVIEFNAIAPSLLAKALEVIVQKEARKSGRRRTPGPLVLKRLGEIGDIRNAISSLEFLCVKGDQEADWGGRVAFTKQKKGVKDGIGLTRGEEESLELISQREASLGIFHAVGKVVYNKREEAKVTDGSEDLPSYLSEYTRPQRSQVSVDALIDETGTDTHTFISALHENYVLSCESTGPMDLSTPVDYINECIEYLSISDLLSSSPDVFFGGRGFSGGRDSASHVLRQDEITFQMAVRGLLFSLPNPVKRRTTTGKGSDAFKMFYPASLKLWRAKEEIEGLVDLWSTRLLRGEEAVAPTKDLTAGASIFRRAQMAREQSDQRRQQQNSPRKASIKDETGSTNAAPLLSLGSAARNEMVLERLPYMAHMSRGKNKGTHSRELEKIVAFQGISSTGDESDADEDDTPPGEVWATDRPSEEASPKKKRTGIKSSAMTSMLAQKLVLSDDDIED